ncbi:MAG TPA: hypothetical protein VI932_12190 [Bacteroidota bacterium]|nr:hypothetical protein [Bacteroidota bacterium]
MRSRFTSMIVLIGVSAALGFAGGFTVAQAPPSTTFSVSIPDSYIADLGAYAKTKLSTVENETNSAAITRYLKRCVFDCYVAAKKSTAESTASTTVTGTYNQARIDIGGALGVGTSGP